ncbi:dTDP-4-dehydrorhamnose reductase [Hyphomonas sp.]|uniref:dTDP-4-dehydrorhamnose reductase n=1 Tax=Hyphomonas sp. TaxID=87 RepID=UPI003562EC5C
MSDNLKILVAGRAGQVAQALVNLPVPPGVGIVSLGRPQLDICDEFKIEAAISSILPDIVINAAAYTAVDQAESDAAAAFALNRDGAANLSKASAARGIPILHLSTDYVFDGTKPTPYVEDDPVAPLGVYGASKLAGEAAVAAANAAHVILRTAWVYSPVGKNFVKTMLRVADSRDELAIVDDQIGNPTSAHDIAAGLLGIARRIAGSQDWQSGIYHMTSAGEASWADFAQFIFETSGALGGPVAHVKRITSAQYPTPVTRPGNSRLDCRRLSAHFGVTLPVWQGSTRACVEELIKTKGWSA